MSKQRQKRRQQLKREHVNSGANQIDTTVPSRGFWLSSITVFALMSIVLGAIIYVPAFDAPFVLDSADHISFNTRVHDLFSGNWFYSRRPLPMLSIAVDYFLYGDSPSGFLFTNLMIHVLAAIFLFSLIQLTLKLRTAGLQQSDGESSARLPGETQIPFFAALIWLVHPLQSQSVIYHIQRMESMMGLFLFMCLFCTGKFIASKNNNTLWILAALGSAILSAMSKEVGFVTPLLMLAYYYVFQDWEVIRKQKKFLILLVVVMIFAGIWFGWKLWSGNAMGSLGFPDRKTKSIYYLATQTVVLLFYIRLAIFPFGQNLDHGYPYLESLSNAVLPGLLLTLILAFGAFRLAQRKPSGFLVVSFFLVLAPTSSIVPISDLAFEHRMYVPLASLILGAVTWICRSKLWGGNQNYLLIALVCLLTIASIVRCQTWRNEVTLWRDCATKAPHNPRPFSELATALAKENRFDEAIENFEVALEIIDNPPKNIFIQQKSENRIASRLGKLYFVTGRREMAKELFRKWFDGDEYFYQHLDAALLFADSGDMTHAEPLFDSARKLAGTDQQQAFVLVEHGRSLLSSNRAVEGRKLLQQAVQLDASNWKAHNNFGIAIMSTDQDAQLAQSHFRRAVELSNGHPEAVANLQRIDQMIGNSN